MSFGSLDKNKVSWCTNGFFGSKCFAVKRVGQVPTGCFKTQDSTFRFSQRELGVVLMKKIDECSH